MGNSGWTGGLMERDLLGVCWLHMPEEIPTYQPYPVAIAEIKAAAVFDPTDPAPRWLNSVHFLIAETLKFQVNELKVYTAIAAVGHSSADFHHGVDAFFECKGRRVTSDVSFREKEDVKADVFILIKDDEDIDGQAGIVAKLIAEQFRHLGVGSAA